jgi:hypothetical protein
VVIARNPALAVLFADAAARRVATGYPLAAGPAADTSRLRRSSGLWGCRHFLFGFMYKQAMRARNAAAKRQTQFSWDLYQQHPRIRATTAAEIRRMTLRTYVRNVPSRVRSCLFRLDLARPLSVRATQGWDVAPSLACDQRFARNSTAPS